MAASGQVAVPKFSILTHQFFTRKPFSTSLPSERDKRGEGTVWDLREGAPLLPFCRADIPGGGLCPFTTIEMSWG